MTVADTEFAEQKRKILSYQTGDFRDHRETPSPRRSQAPHVVAVVGDVGSGKTSFINLISQATSERDDEMYRPRSYVSRVEEVATLRTELFKLTNCLYVEDRPGLPKQATESLLATYLHAATNGIPWNETESPPHRVPIAVKGVSPKDVSLVAFCVSGTDLIPELALKRADDTAPTPEETPALKNWKLAQQVMSREHGGLPFVFVITKIDLVAESLQCTETEAASRARDKLSVIAGCPSSAIIVIRSYADEYDTPRNKDIELQALQAFERILTWCDAYIRFDNPPTATRLAEFFGIAQLLQNTQQMTRPRESQPHHSMHNSDVSLGNLLLKQMFISFLFVLVVLCAVLLFVSKPNPSQRF